MASEPRHMVLMPYENFAKWKNKKILPTLACQHIFNSLINIGDRYDQSWPILQSGTVAWNEQ